MFNVGDKVTISQIVEVFFGTGSAEKNLIGKVGQVTEVTEPYIDAEYVPFIKVNFSEKEFSWFYAEELGLVGE